MSGLRRIRNNLPRSDDYNPCFVNMPCCSVIVVTYNSGAQIGACLRALAAQPCEIIVVDNASQDDTVSRVQALAKEVPLRLVRMPRNLGFAAGVNQGARTANTEAILMLNPDAVAEVGAIDALLSGLAKSGAAAASGSLLDEDGSPAKGFSFRRLPTLSSLLCEVLLVNQAWPSNPVNRRYRCLEADYSREQEVEQPAGACLAVRRENWERLGGMDAGFYPVWFEDVDFCLRVRQSGGRIMYCPAARFRHIGAHSVGQLDFEARQVYWYRNMLRYAGKHFAAWKILILRLGILTGIMIRVTAALLGSRPKGVPLGQAVHGYWRVVRIALSGCGKSHSRLFGDSLRG